MNKLVLHLGAPKCASSVLQSVLELAGKDGRLDKYSVEYPMECSRGSGYGNATPLLVECQTHKKENHNFQETRSFLERRQGEVVILSDEMLYGVFNPSLKEVVPMFWELSFHDVEIVLSIRSPKDWLLSDYNQHIKTGVSDANFIQHVVARERSCRWLEYLTVMCNEVRKIKDIKGNIRLNVVLSSALLECVESLSGIPLGELNEYIKDSSLNKSVSVDNLESKHFSSRLGLKEAEDLSFVDGFFKGFDLNKVYWPLLEYIEEKNINYIEKIKSLDGIVFYDADC